MEHKSQAETPREFALMQRINELETELYDIRYKSPEPPVFLGERSPGEFVDIAMDHHEVLQMANLTVKQDYSQFCGVVKARTHNPMEYYEYSFFFGDREVYPDPTRLMQELMKNFIRDIGKDLAKKSIFG